MSLFLLTCPALVDTFRIGTHIRFFLYIYIPFFDRLSPHGSTSYTFFDRVRNIILSGFPCNSQWFKYLYSWCPCPNHPHKWFKYLYSWSPCTNHPHKWFKYLYLWHPCTNPLLEWSKYLYLWHPCTVLFSAIPSHGANSYFAPAFLFLFQLNLHMAQTLILPLHFFWLH